MLGDLAPIELAMRATQAKLLVIDPMTAYLGKTDSYKDAEVRGLLSPLADLADKRKIAILAIMHLNKSLALAGIHRIGGSVAFGAAARVVLAVVAMEDGARLFGVIKNNLAPPVDPWTFHIRADVACGRFEWGEAREDLNISNLLAQGSNSAGSPGRAEDKKLAEAIEEIFNRHDDRRVASSVLVEELGKAGFQISKITKREGRILRELGVTGTHWYEGEKEIGGWKFVGILDVVPEGFNPRAEAAKPNRKG